MRKEPLLVSTVMNGVEQKSIWDSSRSKHRLGVGAEWQLEEVRGQIVLRKTTTRKKWMVPLTAIDNQTPIQAENLQVRIRRSPPLFILRPDSIGSAQTPSVGIQVYVWIGGMLTSTTVLTSSFDGIAQRRRVFEVMARQDHILIRLMRPEVEVNLKGKVLSEPEKGWIKVAATDLPLLQIKMHQMRWNFSRVQLSTLSAVPAVEDDAETVIFKRNLKIVTAATLLLLAIGLAVVSLTSQERPKPPENKGEFAKVILAPLPPVPQPEVQVQEAPPVETPVLKPITTPKKAVVAQPKLAPKPKPDLGQSLANSLKGMEQSLASSQVRWSKKNQVSPLGRASSAGPLGSVPVGQAGGVLTNEGTASPVQVGRVGEGSIQTAALGGSSKGSVTGASLGSADLGVAIGTPGSGSDAGLSREEVLAVIRAHMNEVRNCYETALVRNPTLEGKILAGFTIGATGMVIEADARNSTVGDEFLDQCVLGRLKTWKFPRPKGTPKVSVTYPFLFRRI